MLVVAAEYEARVNLDFRIMAMFMVKNGQKVSRNTLEVFQSHHFLMRGSRRCVQTEIEFNHSGIGKCREFLDLH